MAGMATRFRRPGQIPNPLADDQPTRPRHILQRVREHTRSPLVDGALMWALGERAEAPVTGTITGHRPTRADAEAELQVLDEKIGGHFPRMTDTGETDEEDAANHALVRVMEWLAGRTDIPPVLGYGKSRGELTGGWDDIVRSPAEILNAIARAKAEQDALPRFDRGCHGLQGTIDALRWALDGGMAPVQRTGFDGGFEKPIRTTGRGAWRDVRAEESAATTWADPRMWRWHHPDADADAETLYCTHVMYAMQWLLGRVSLGLADEPMPGQVKPLIY